MVQTLGEDEAVDLLAGSELVALPGYDGRSTPGVAASSTWIWAPDGESLVFVASRNRDRAAFAFTHTDLWQVSVAGGEPRRLTGADGLEAATAGATPAFSPDGRSLYALRVPRTDRVYNAARLAQLELAGGRSPAARSRCRTRARCCSIRSRRTAASCSCCPTTPDT
jgi:hypothetical protein